MDNNIYEQYAVLDSKIKALTLEKDSFKDQILEDLVETETPSVNTSFGKFTVSKLKSWKYTEAVEEKTEELKALKAKEESTGDATYEEKPSLRFTQIKF
jgi:hypothetical protein